VGSPTSTAITAAILASGALAGCSGFDINAGGSGDAAELGVASRASSGHSRDSGQTFPDSGKKDLGDATAGHTRDGGTLGRRTPATPVTATRLQRATSWRS
jgi:hypothetical protein